MMMNKKAQVTIFIIIAILLVAVVTGYFIFREDMSKTTLPVSIQPVYETFLSCLEEDVFNGISILESQAGYISLPDFEPGSSYMPFSSELNFVGSSVPYWYYVSGNNIQKEQVPSLRFMEKELEAFVAGRINQCKFDSYYEEGFEISVGDASANVNIKDNIVEINLNMDLEVVKGEDSAVLNNHNVVVNSKLGKLYNSARKVYDAEQDTLFLENYAVDILRTYAPVDGVELTCSPLVWNADEVFDELQEAIEENTLALKSKEGEYTLKDKKDKYFITDVEVEETVRYLTSKDWPHSFEVNPSDESMMISKPVGNQPGMGILGFCYVPYHFVYNVKYPVLVQVYSEGSDEIFQFPLAVVLQGNTPREPLASVDTGETVGLPELCSNKNIMLEVNTYDTQLNSIDADVSYECFGTTCMIGQTEQGNIKTMFPQCVNGFVRARAEGYADAKYLYSTTVEEGSIDVIMDKMYELEINLKKDHVDYDRYAIITFSSDKNSQTVIYPSQKTVELIEGDYEIQVQTYRNSSLRFQESVTEECVDAPSSGLGGLVGATEEKCFEIVIPEQIISNALSGGGTQQYYILESELSGASSIVINGRGLPTPDSLETLQDNYLLFEEKDLDVYFE